MADPNLLTGPVVIFEDGDEDAIFFATLDEALEDRDDILWGDRYVGYDAHGRRFTVRRIDCRRPRLFGLLQTTVSVLELDTIDDGSFADEAKSRIATWLRVVARECTGEWDGAVWPEQARRSYSAAALEAKSLEELFNLGLEWVRDEPQF